MENMKYDIVGDIHGHADTLEVLLHKLGYRRKFGVYSQPENRKMVFAGEFIDRGPKIRETLHLVRAMIQSTLSFFAFSVPALTHSLDAGAAMQWFLDTEKQRIISLESHRYGYRTDYFGAILSKTPT
jgi:hypothetical protein